MKTIFVKKIVVFLFIIGTLAIINVYSSPSHAENDYEKGKRSWFGQDYQSSYDYLMSYRSQPYGKRPEVDYMLGTSGCRLPGLRKWGADVLDWMCYAYPLLPESRRVVTNERDMCMRTSETTMATMADLRLFNDLISAGMSGKGKTFYWVDRTVPVNSYPARRKRQIDLQGRLQPIGRGSEAAVNVRRLVPDFDVMVFERFVIASGSKHSPDELKRISDQLENFLSFLIRRYGVAVSEYYMTLYLVRDVETLRKLAERVHGLDVSPATIGYAFREDLSVVAVIPGKEIGTLKHELFHLAVRNNFGDIPQFLDEGMAGLYEVSKTRGDEVLGEPNWRGEVLRRLWSQRPSLEQLIRSEWFPFDLPDQYDDPTADRPSVQKLAAYMAMARYFALYLQEKKKLADVYMAFREQGPARMEISVQDHVLKLVERILRNTIQETQLDFEKWFKQVETR